MTTLMWICSIGKIKLKWPRKKFVERKEKSLFLDVDHESQATRYEKPVLVLPEVVKIGMSG